MLTTNALAEIINDLYKTEVVCRRHPPQPVGGTRAKLEQTSNSRRWNLPTAEETLKKINAAPVDPKLMRAALAEGTGMDWKDRARLHVDLFEHFYSRLSGTDRLKKMIVTVPSLNFRVLALEDLVLSCPKAVDCSVLDRSLSRIAINNLIPEIAAKHPLVLGEGKSVSFDEGSFLKELMQRVETHGTG